MTFYRIQIEQARKHNLLDHSFIVFVVVIVFAIVFVFVIVFFRESMSPHHSDYMSQESQFSSECSIVVFSNNVEEGVTY